MAIGAIALALLTSCGSPGERAIAPIGEELGNTSVGSQPPAASTPSSEDAQTDDRNVGGESAEFPAGWPDDIPKPSVTEFERATQTEHGHHQVSFRLTGRAAHSVENDVVLAHYAALLVEAGFELVEYRDEGGLLEGIYQRPNGIVLDDGFELADELFVDAFELDSGLVEQYVLLDVGLFMHRTLTIEDQPGSPSEDPLPRARL